MQDPIEREEALRNVARQRVKRRKKFYSELLTYFGVIGMLLFINLRTSPGRLWVLFVAIPWGIALLINYMKAFGVPFFGVIDEEWEQNAIEKEMEKLSKRQAQNSARELPDGRDWPDLPEKETEESMRRRRPPEEDELV